MNVFWDQLATSYAPGHNFWRGGPIDWWARGVMMALVLNLGPIVGGTLMIWLTRRFRSVLNILAGLLIIAVITSLTLTTFQYRDADMPTAMGWRWGCYAIWPLTSLSTLLALWQLFHRVRQPSGFDVLTNDTARQGDTDSGATVV